MRVNQDLVGSHLVVIEPALAVLTTKPVVEVVHESTMAATTQRAARKEDMAQKYMRENLPPNRN